MFNIKKILVLILFCLLSFAVYADERILSFDSKITVNKDASVVVEETIKVNVENQQIKHGIYRTFPLKREGKNVGFNVLDVKLNGKYETHHLQYQNDNVLVYIGDENIVIPTGEQIYTIQYETTNQLGIFQDYDEIYWNVTGNEWAFPIDNISATITLPEGANVKQYAGYSGLKGAKGTDFTSQTLAPNVMSFTSTRPFNIGEGLTVAVGFDKGIIDYANMKSIDVPVWFIIYSTISSLIFLYYFITWYKYGRDKFSKVIVPQYDLP